VLDDACELDEHGPNAASETNSWVIPGWVMWSPEHLHATSRWSFRHTPIRFRSNGHLRRRG